MRLQRLRWLILGLLAASTLINYVDRVALSVLFPALRTDLGLSSSGYGEITMIFMLAYMVGQLLAGMWTDRMGTRAAMTVFVLVWSIAALLHAFAAGGLSLGVLRGVLGLSEAGNWPAGVKAISRWFSSEHRAFAMAVFDGASAIGAIIAPPLVVAISLKWGWRGAFVGTSLLGLIWLAGWLWIYQTPERHPWLAAEDRATAAREADDGKASASFGSALRLILGTRALWALLAVRTLATPVWWFYVFWLPDYLSQGRGMSLKEIGMYGWIPYLASTLGQMAGGTVSDRLLARGWSATVARKGAMVCAGVFMLAGVRVVGAPSAFAAIAWVSFATFGFGIWSANILALYADLFPPEVTASAVGFNGMGASLGGAAFTFFVGRLVGSLGYTPVFWIAGTLPIAACVALVFGLGRVTRVTLAS